MSSVLLRLRLFGPPVLTGADGAPVGGGVAEPHRLALLALLALHPKRSVSRAELTRYLWPTQPAKQASQLLNQALFAISRALGDDAIFPSAKEVRLGARVSVDALEFQSALEDGRPDDAMQLYTSPLLDGFELDDAPEFQNWIATQRARFSAAARTQRPVAEEEHDVLHDLSLPEEPEPEEPEPEKPEPESESEVVPRPAAGRKAELPMDFVLAEPEVQAQVERTVEQSPEGPELRPQQPPPPEPALMTNAVPAEPEPVANVAPPELSEPVDVVPPQPAPQDDVRWIDPEEPPPSVLETPADVASPLPVEKAEDVVLPGEAPSAPETAPVERAPEKKPAKRRRRPLPRPSPRVVITVLVLVALGAIGYMARGWIGAARGGVEASVEAARSGIAAARERAEAAQRARDRERSIAVLPIEYSGRNQADAALAARISDGLGPMLTSSGLIAVPGAAFTRGGSPSALRAIADSLNVAYLLQGVMQKDGAEVGFRFRLVNPLDGSTQWDESFRPKLADIQVMQEHVAATVADRILREPRERD